MSIVSKFLQLFNRNIKISKKAQDQLVSISNSNGIVKVGSHLTVPEGFVAIICTKGKLCDIFTAGEYDLEPGMIRKATKIRKLSKPNKKGKFKTKFKGFVYFVNLKQFDNEVFESYNGVVTKQPKLFKTIVTLNGTFSFKVSNPKKFMQTLISCYYNVSGDLPLQQVKLWAGEYADKFVQSKKLIFEYFLNKIDILNDGCFNYMKKEFDTVGIELIDFKITNVVYPKSIKKKLDGGKIFFNNMEKVIKEENEKKEKLEQISKEENVDLNNKEQDFNDNLFENNDEDKDENTKDLNEQDNLNNKDENEEDLTKSKENSLQDLFNSQDDTDYLATNFNTDYIYSAEQNNEFLNNNPAYNQIQSNNIDKKENETEDLTNITEKEQQVDLDSNAINNIDEINNIEDEEIKSEVIKYKVCENCGANNPIDSKECFNCKNEFCKICNTCGEKVKSSEFVCPKCGTIII